jgi:hypothetical protein
MGQLIASTVTIVRTRIGRTKMPTFPAKSRSSSFGLRLLGVVGISTALSWLDVGSAECVSAPKHCPLSASKIAPCSAASGDSGLSPLRLVRHHDGERVTERYSRCNKLVTETRPLDRRCTSVRSMIASRRGRGCFHQGQVDTAPCGRACW